jgi:hypothetical protein
MTDRWSDDQYILALEFYYTCDERMHTDSHSTCQVVAHEIGKGPRALDLIIRNIKYADTNGAAGMPNAAKRIFELVEEYRGRTNDLKARAAEIRERLGLGPLQCTD